LWLAGAVPAALRVDGECSGEFAAGGVDDAYVEVVDEENDAGSVEVRPSPMWCIWPLIRRLTRPV
jgi:hypothetical protein